MLIVEDGVGRVDAESYAEVVDADAFWADRNVTKWTALDPALKEGYLRQGFTYLTLAYSWPGQPVLVDQGGAWPRGLAYDRSGVIIADNIVPKAVQIANIMLAYEAIDTNLLANATADPALSRTDTKVGPITISKQYEVTKQPRGLPRFPAVDALLREIAGARTVGGIRTMRLIRA